MVPTVPYKVIKIYQTRSKILISTQVDGGDFYYFPHGGHVLLEPPPVVSGGLLADGMGYGKTITALALIAADKKKYKRPAHEAGTLVVVPRSLYGQWKAECETKAPGLKTLALDASGYISLDHVREADVVLLRQDQLSQFRTKVSWRRVVVDECQFVANDTSRLASATAGLDATHVWMLSGTPITTKIADLQGNPILKRESLRENGELAFAKTEVKYFTDELKKRGVI